MSLILHIDTATEIAHVSIANNGLILRWLTNSSQKDHAAFVQVAIQQLVADTGISLKDLDAIAVVAGPGSYTGLRVGMASAKGLCYALDKPLIALDTLIVWAASAKQATKDPANPHLLFCPMIDARRQEVFTAIYDQNLEIILAPCAMILDKTSFTGQLLKNNILFFGNGAEKWKQLCNNPNASFINSTILPEAISRLAFELHTRKIYTELVESQPVYLKDFQDSAKKSLPI